jgi:hypothetical protein
MNLFNKKVSAKIKQILLKNKGGFLVHFFQDGTM